MNKFSFIKELRQTFTSSHKKLWLTKYEEYELIKQTLVKRIKNIPLLIFFRLTTYRNKNLRNTKIA